MKKTVTIIGGGLAGCEAALYLSENGINVNLYEMKPEKMSPVHADQNLAEIVCSNSLGSVITKKAPGVLKAELFELGSPLMKIAQENSVPAGNSLSVNRQNFSAIITKKIEDSPLINLVHKEIEEFPEEPAIIATGPVTSDKFKETLKEYFEDQLYFYDAVSPIVSKDSIDLSRGFFGSRYEDENRDYYNIPFNQEEYDVLVNEILNADIVPLSEFDKPVFYESCLPVEEILRRGPDTLRYGPMKPVGFDKSIYAGQKRPHAIMQLRKENIEADSFNIVGFQTRMKWGEQKRILKLIPGFENIEILRYGLIHRNFYIYSPGQLNCDLSLKKNKNVFFAGQMTGVEGYVESIMTGLVAGINLKRRLEGKETVTPDKKTITGSLLLYISDETIPQKDFKPMNANFGISGIIKGKPRDKNRTEYGIAAVKKISEQFKEN